MKKKLTFLTILVITVITVNGQDEPYGYITKDPIVVYGYDFITSRSDPSVVKIASPNLKFRQIGDVKSDPNLGPIYVIQFWKLKQESSELTGDNSKINKSSTDGYQYYCVKADVYKEPSIQKYYLTWRYNNKANFGTLVVPMKLRPKKGDIPFDFTTDFTLGGSVGYGARISHYQPNYLSIVGVFGVTSVGVDSLTTKGYVKDSNTKFAAITPGIGLILEITGFQIGLVIGWDIIGGSTGKNWVYNGSTWISFGIGYQFLRKS